MIEQYLPVPVSDDATIADIADRFREAVVEFNEAYAALVTRGVTVDLVSDMKAPGKLIVKGISKTETNVINF